MHRLILLLILFVVSVMPVVAQKQAARVTTSAVDGSTPGSGTLYHGDRNEPPRAITFNDNTVATAQFLTNINQYFQIPAAFTFIETESNTDQLGMRHYRMQQYYKGLPIEGMVYRVHEKNGYVRSANGKAVREINLDTRTILSEEQAFRLALRHLNSTDSVFRSARKMIVSKNFSYTPESFVVVYQFDIDVNFIERWKVSIDARNGNVVNKVSLIHSCFNEPALPVSYGTGTGIANYYGKRTVQVEFADNGSSRLYGKTPSGGTIHTRDLNHTPFRAWQFGFFNATDFWSDNNTFNAEDEEPGVAAHWGGEQAYEFYFKTFNRRSFDNSNSAINMFVHLDVNLNNAFWGRNTLVFGDGSNNNPLVDLDVVGHELTHGVTQYEAGLNYYNEPGALNESFSDIFGKAIDFYALGDTATWQLAPNSHPGGIRDISNPNLKNQPDTYAGFLWYTGAGDYGGVHYNSGVQNYWFYLLCEGGTGTNDHGFDYSVESIGVEMAIRIAYRNLTEYLDYQSDYLDSRIGSLLATADLYGNNSNAYQQVDHAWDAVGVIDEPIITSLVPYDITATTVKLSGTLLPRGESVTYHFEYGTTLAVETSSPSYNYTGTVEGKITGLQSQTKYYLRLVATNENGASYSVPIQFTTLSLKPLVKIKQTGDMTETTAILPGAVNPNSLPTTFYFEYGTSASLGQTSTVYQIGDTTEFVDVSATISSLQPRKKYFYRLVATNGFASATSEMSSFFTATKPVITSFSPRTATPGTEVTITGQNFSPTPINNVVTFGATRATVVSASATEIKVTVPPGASNGAIALVDLESGLRAESAHEFVPTFVGEFKKGHLQIRAGNSDYYFTQMFIDDVDRDGRPDIVVHMGNQFAIYQNVNQGGDITDASFVRVIYPSDLPDNFYLADIDGNGQKDIVGKNGFMLKIYRNFSAPGFVFFDAPVDIPITDLRDFTLDDFDQDGRIDIAAMRYGPNDTSVLTIIRNKNQGGALLAANFAAIHSKTLSYYGYYVTSADLNNDGKPEVIAGAHDKYFVSLLENNSLPGAVAFHTTTMQDSTLWARYTARDLNKDGLKDIISIPWGGYVGDFKLFENKSTSSDILMDRPAGILTEQRWAAIQSGDINGDGNVDLVAGIDSGKFVLMMNKNTGGDISASSFEMFDELGDIDLYTQFFDLAINDLNGDGRPEVITNYNYNRMNGMQLEIWQNSPANCLDPSLITVNPSVYQATIVLPPNTTLDDFEIQVGYVGTETWWWPQSTTIENLSPGREYRFRARAKCFRGYTSYAYSTFITDCVNDISLWISNIGVNYVYLGATSWNFGALEIQYSRADQDDWITVPQGTNFIGNLVQGTKYDLRYRVRCLTETDYEYQQFTTACPSLSNVYVTDITYDKATARWTSGFSGNVTLEYSSDNRNWITAGPDGELFPLVPGKTYFVRAFMICNDLNSDMITTTFTPPCAKVSNIEVINQTPFGARVFWTDDSGASKYVVKYWVSNEVAETTRETTSTSIDLEGLTPGTSYIIAVAPYCFSLMDFSYTTLTTICYAPFDLAADEVTHTTVELSWQDNFSGPPYYVDYAIEGSDEWQTRQTTTTAISLNGLRPGTSYEAKVHINCVSVDAPYVALRFNTEFYEATTVSPNPTYGEVVLNPSIDLIGNHYSILDNMGKKLMEGEVSEYSFDLSGYSAGVYILKIDGETPIKIFKQ